MSDLSEYDLSRVALFPLPGVVLFPRAVLPLHIFEQRYRAMTADALVGDKLIVMALLRPGWQKSYYGRAEIEPVVCIGKILSHEMLADGKYNFLLQGQIRARVVEEIIDPERPYRTARLARLEELPTSESDLEPQRRRLGELFAGNAPLGRSGTGAQFRQIVRDGVLSTADVADVAAFTFLECAELKQSLLADGDVRARVERTIEALQRVGAALPQMMNISAPPDPSMN